MLVNVLRILLPVPMDIIHQVIMITYLFRRPVVQSLVISGKCMSYVNKRCTINPIGRENENRRKRHASPMIHNAKGTQVSTNRQSMLQHPPYPKLHAIFP